MLTLRSASLARCECSSCAINFWFAVCSISSSSLLCSSSVGDGGDLKPDEESEVGFKCLGCPAGFGGCLVVSEAAGVAVDIVAGKSGLGPNVRGGVGLGMLADGVEMSADSGPVALMPMGGRSCKVWIRLCSTSVLISVPKSAARSLYPAVSASCRSSRRVDATLWFFQYVVLRSRSSQCARAVSNSPSTLSLHWHASHT